MPGFMGMQGLDCDTGCRQRGECKASNDELIKRAHEKATNILLKRRGGMSGDAADANAAGAACRKSLRSMVGEIMSTNVVALKFDGNLLTADCVFPM